jgi:DNA-binding transcriptional MerR regulator
LLLRKKDLYDRVGVPKSTVADWITEFHVYIPTVKQGNMTYYKPEAVEVLNFIKELREQNYSKAQIMTMLAEEGFPITVDEAVEDVKKALDTTNARDTLLTVMQTMGQAVVQLAEQNESIKELQERQDEQDGRITELERKTDEIEELKKQIEELKAELAAAREEQNTGFFSWLFKRKKR